MSRSHDERVVVAIDVGGTRIKAALVDSSMRVVSELVVPTPAGLGDALGDVVDDVTGTMLNRQAQAGAPVRVAAAGVVVPGLVDDIEGVGRYSANLGWRDLPLRAVVHERLGVPTAVGHDVRAGLLAESRIGVVQGRRHALFLPVGTGIAGALMLDGQVLNVDGYAGEVGHVAVRREGPLCACGRRGCLEAVASAAAIERRYEQRTTHRRTAEEIAGRVETDPDAGAVWDEAVDALADAVVLTVTATGVDFVVVGGGLAQSGDTLLTPLRAAVTERLTFERPVTIVAASLGDRAGALGAACLAWDAL